MGQERQKKHMEEQDFSKWGTLELKAVSSEGEWISSHMSYENHLDTLFLIRTETAKSYAFPKCRDPRFGKEDIFAFLSDDSKLRIKDLKSETVKTIENVSRYELIDGGKYILTLNRNHGIKSLLTIWDRRYKIIDTISGVLEYKLNFNSTALLFSFEKKGLNEIGIINFNSYSRENITEDKQAKFYNLTWHKNGLAVAFLSKTGKSSERDVINYYNIRERKLFTSFSSFNDGRTSPVIYSRLPLSISSDAGIVFFRENKTIGNDSQAGIGVVEIWNGNDKAIYPDRIRMEAGGIKLLLSAWEPKSNRFLEISSTDQTETRLTGKEDYIISYNKNAYGRQEIYQPEADFYIQNIKNNSRELFLKKFTIDTYRMIFDPMSNKILYYRENNWWIYNPEYKTHLNITGKITAKWDNSSEESAPHQFRVYNCAGWSSCGRKVILYDRNDIWLADTDGSSVKRLTRGKEKNMIFRIDKSEYSLEKPEILNLSGNLILKAVNTDDWSAGYFTFNIKSDKKLLVYGQKDYSHIYKSAGNFYVYITQSFNSAPQIEFIKKNSTKPSVLFKSNQQQKEYFYGRSELLFYSAGNGEKLKAALFYPADFDPEKKYPMIVHIYDSMSKELHKYVNPSLLNMEGFNITNYTLKNYFVLLPDINYQIGNTGFSALDCVKAAVNETIKKTSIDPLKIGLYGHSFGGYETCFIVSQSDIFAAAISGAGISDNIGFYFNISRNAVFKSDMWRFESQQWRMGKSLYENKESYLRNSPIIYADNVKTPLLLWTGKEDRVVPWSQSTAYYLALRRLGKKTILLSYPKQDHSLENTESQIDLTRRMMQWFDYFLKNKSIHWIEKGTSE
ncbi:hypothetical protein B0A63_11930 [Flavobacterium johnsoniae UW101]|uniref:Peptidase family S9, prolyl oligopeptidase active site domain protein n=2 Tax=Flavobacterium johnsoniae TaxID=986 RepID=A5FBN0_FLAJ1|nr:peptidase family S9, prolyl oligopeptidase active site domain protein [Flavobacterium johnsoniae UW101]OXE99295.1 hypothetical protein B0A63_11930 [Flavobacterium johnsoniae UW101]